MATPKGFFAASAGAATTFVMASMMAGSIGTGADNFVIRVETGSARWTDGGVPPTATAGIPLLAGDGPIRVGPLTTVMLQGAGILHIQGYQGFFVL